MFSTLANKLSLFRMLLSPVFFLMIISEDALMQQLSIAVFLIAAMTDWYDGEIARRSGTVTNIGKFLDPLADKFLTSAAFIAFAVLELVPWWMVIVIVLRDLIITVLRSLAESRNVHIITSKAAQTKTFIQMTVLYYLLLLVVGQDVLWIRELLGGAIDALLHPTVTYLLMLVVTLLTVTTGIQYVIDNRRFVTGLFGKRKQLAG
ncbi:MAG: CDP-diacylglycerol--glycerol-3-phosphate 3-phosphatidyltransferase [Bacteroidetes bacterium]|nr:CDP-diacylglycerol--glycerol-3-phosphate 3-phosphatidyltransferase [Bacteroidota bacterium]